MKSIRLLVAALVLVPSLAMAKGGGNTMAGCGLGYLIFGKDETKGPQILAATTNGTFYSQTFGISTGTSGCTEDGAMKLSSTIGAFAEMNLVSLQKEMAVGRGEFVETLAKLINTSSAAKQAALVAVFKANYESLFPTAGTTSEEFLKNLSAVLTDRPELLA